jgi:hypothetical protein
MKKHRIQKKVEKQTDYQPKNEPSLDWLACKLNNNFHTKQFLTDFFDLHSTLFDIQTITIKDGSQILKYSNGLVWLELPIRTDLYIKLNIASGGFSIYFDEQDLDSFLKWIYNNSPFSEDEHGAEYKSAITRIDIALDDTIGLIPMTSLYKFFRNRQIKTKLRLARPQFSVNIKTGVRCDGFTWYLGQRTNSLFIRFYDKSAMQRELKIKLEDSTEICNRMEFELKDKLANQLFTDYLFKEDFNFREFFQSKISIKSRKMEIGEKHKERIPDHANWEQFMKSCEAKKLVLPKDRYNYDTLRKYMEEKNASALGTYLAINGNLETIMQIYKYKKESGELNLRHMNLLSSNPTRFDSDSLLNTKIKKFRSAG